MGGQTKLAEALNKTEVLKTAKKPVRQGHVWQWLRKHKKPSPRYARAIEEATKGLVTRYQILPDEFGEEAA